MEYYLIVGALSILIILLSTSIHKTKDDKEESFKTIIASITLIFTTGALGYYLYKNWSFIHPSDEILIDRFLRMDEY